MCRRLHGDLKKPADKKLKSNRCTPDAEVTPKIHSLKRRYSGAVTAKKSS
jgi:hypothetical protein|tara:strand:+ start:700 stop:849 length:150 start_codon:yes stop_codon:yes gene_type:complete